jgi:hypothetical protein
MSTAVAKRATTAVKFVPIADVVVQILYDAKTLQGRANKHRVQAGQKLLELRQRIEAGEEGDVAWWDWFETQDIVRSRKDAEKLMRIASAEDPEAALEDDNAKARERMRKLRDGANVRSKPEATPQALIDQRIEIQVELETRGVDYCKAVIFDAKQAKALGGPAEPRLGWYSVTACSGDAAEEAFNEAVAAIRERKEGKLPEPTRVRVRTEEVELPMTRVSVTTAPPVPERDSKPPLAASVQALERARRGSTWWLSVSA